MANPRKLQGEIDKLIKKINEGMEIYDEVFDKVQNAATQALKEKHEADLKKEIKKLQRLRETVKGHIADPQVKDKKQLEQYRRFVEEKMESFKVCERETKTKTFSKEGLASRPDPADTPKSRMEAFIADTISSLQEQIEQLEYDVASEAPKGGRKRRGGGGGPTPAEEKLNGVRLYSMRLEQMLRLLNNDEVEVEELEDMQQDIENFLEDVPDLDVFDEMVLEIFDPFDLPDVDANKEDEDDGEAEAAAAAVAAAAAKEKAKLAAATSSTPKEAPKKPEEKSPAQEAAGGRVVMKKEVPAAASTAKTAATPPTAAAAAPAKTPAKAAAKEPPAAAKAKAASPATVAATAAPTKSSPVSAAKDSSQLPSLPSQPLPTSPTARDEMAAEMGALEDDDDALNDDTFGDDAMDIGGGPSSGLGMGSLADMANATKALGGDWGKGRPDIKKDEPKREVNEAPAASAEPAPVEAPIPPAASAAPAAPLTTAQRLLAMSYDNLPDAKDSERLKAFVPPNPYKTPSFYPQEVHTGFNSTELFSKLDPDTLFFVFYYQQQTYQQYLAARELKRQSWRYHRKFHTWFQRHEKPTAATDEFERGAYVYFDYENGWCQRIKTDFTFKYQYLEDELS